MKQKNILRKYSIFKTVPLLLFFLSFLFPLDIYSREYGWHSYGPLEPEDDVATFIEPSVVGQPIFNHDYYFRDELDWEQIRKRVKAQQEWVEEGNVDEWRDQLLKNWGILVSRKQTIDFFYGSSSKAIEDEEWIKGNSSIQKKLSIVQTRETNFPKKIDDCADLKEYVDFINALNPILEKIGDDSWTPYQGNISQDLAPFLQIALKRVGIKDLDPFLRSKYGFQLIRIAVQMKNPDNAVKYYEQYFGKSLIQSLTRYRALGFRAMAYMQLNKKSQALHDYLEIIDQCPVLRAREIESTRRAFERKDFLDFARGEENPHRLTTLYYVLGVYDPADYSYETLEKMLEYGKKEAQTEVALVRTIRSIEKNNFEFDRFSLIGLGNLTLTATPQYSNSVKKLEKQDISKYSKWIQLFEGASKDKETRQPALWAVAGSYLALLEGNRAESKKLYEEASRENTKNAVLKQQIHLMGTLIGFGDENKEIREDLQNRLVKDLEWAKTLQSDGNNTFLEHSLWVLLGEKYLVLDDLPRAVLSFCSAKGADDISESSEHEKLGNFLLDAIINDRETVFLQQMIQNSSLSSLDRKMVSQSGLIVDDLQVIRAIKEIRKDEYSNALALLSKIPKAYFKGEDRTMHLEQDWGSNSPRDIFYGKKSVICRKKFVFLRDCSLVTKMKMSIQNGQVMAGQETMGLLEYVKMMTQLTRRIKTEKAQGNPKWVSTSYEVAAILAEQPLTKWPEVRKVNGGNRRESYYREKIMDRFPLGIPGIDNDIKKRYNGFVSAMPDYIDKAMENCVSIVEAGVDKEMAAKSQAFIAVLSSGGLGFYDPSKPTAQKHLADLKDNYSNTEFYKNFISWCDSYSPNAYKAKQELIR